MEHKKYLIIGAGITGLNFARNIHNSDFMIIEKDSTVGGLCRTHYSGEFVWDYAGHFFHFSDASLKSFFDMKLKRDALVECEKNTKIIYKHNYIDYPFQKNIHQLTKDEFIDCLYDLYFKNTKDSFDDFEDMLYAKFGVSITEKFLKPYNEKLYACSLKTLDTGAMGRFFPYADLKDIISNMKQSKDTSYNNSFKYPKKGAQVFIEALASDLEQERILLNTEVVSIDTNNKIVKVSQNGIVTEFSYDYLISTMPFNVFAQLANVETNGQGISYNQVLVFNIGFNNALEDVSSHWIYFPEKKYCFYRVGFYNNILSQRNGSLYIELGFDENHIFSDSEIKNYFDKTLEDLKDCGILKNQEVVDYESIIINPGYVHITEKGKRFVKETMNNLAKLNVYSIGRYGAWTYCSMEDSMIQANQLATLIK